jgi:hypothetical protein
VLVSQQQPELHPRLDDDGGALMTMAPNISPSAPLQSQLELRDAECCRVVTVQIVGFAQQRSLEAMSSPLLLMMSGGLGWENHQNFASDLTSGARQAACG